MLNGSGGNLDCSLFKIGENFQNSRCRLVQNEHSPRARSWVCPALAGFGKPIRGLPANAEQAVSLLEGLGSHLH